MKKILSIISLAFLTAPASAQAMADTYIDRDQVALGVTVLLVALILAFLLELTRRYFQYRVKEKILESGVSEELAALLLQPDRRHNLQTCVKWLAIFLGMALGFTIVSLTNPAPWAALAVLSLCLSGSFAGYYLFLKKSDF
ncbi:hypothetical protein [Dyadobacter jiangsuensis]|uniref:DUF2178 domain-containing protein n=1 Tax=Dyadobacter jiangsuensis TaxID=1591085 RepID=A0A2P8GIW5_9BACT|nr:hypothetical protein [Dyadobacter jiangsuensis]PSL33887.1 hypothetical protein CLV60_101256 [Dyadobacter jiangsuensis]